MALEAHDPVVDVGMRQPTGCEALVRWHRAGYSRLIGPAEFIPSARRPA